MKLPANQPAKRSQQEQNHQKFNRCDCVIINILDRDIGISYLELQSLY